MTNQGCCQCGKLIKKRRNIFCNSECFQLHRYESFIKKWKNGEEDGCSGESTSRYIRRYLFEKYDSKCRECGWNKINPITGKIPLTINHKNGDWEDNSEDNLDLLCPNCHSLTPNYGSLNTGNGRKKRLEKIRRACSDNGSTPDLHSGSKGSIPFRSTK